MLARHSEHDPDPTSPSRSGEVVLDIGAGFGALVLWAPPELGDSEIEITPVDDDVRPGTHAVVREREIQGRRLFAAVYPELAEGEWRLRGSRPGLPERVSIRSGEVAELDWRRKEDDGQA